MVAGGCARGARCRGSTGHGRIARAAGLAGLLLDRRIQQERIFTAEGTRGPAQLDHQIDERIVDRLAGGDLDEVAAAPVLDGHAHAGQGFLVLQAHTAERLGGSDLGGEGIGLVGRDGSDLDLGAQRLPQGRLDRQTTKTGSLGGRDATTGQDRQRNGNRSRDLAAPGATRRHGMLFTAGLFRQGTTSYRTWNETHFLERPATLSLRATPAAGSRPKLRLIGRITVQPAGAPARFSASGAAVRQPPTAAGRQP